MNEATFQEPSELRQARLLVMIEAMEKAGLTPIPVMELHAFAFLANVLSPIWDVSPRKRSTKRRKGGPYFPDLQADVDRLIGRGALKIYDLKHVRDEDDRWTLDGSFALVFDKAVVITKTLRAFSDECSLGGLFTEMAFAYSELSPDARLKIANADATYSDSRTGEGAIIDFAEWRQANYSANAANFFDRVMPDGERALPAEKLHLYFQHMRRRLAR